MIPALVAVLSAGGLGLAWALLRVPLRARDVPVEAEERDDVRFGFDHAGLC